MTQPAFDQFTSSFDDIYRAVGDDLELVPWARLAPREDLMSWLDSPPGPAAPTVPSPPGRALVVACGLGDDAEELARRGFSVVAFDFSPTAVGICRRRFPTSLVDYQVADLLALPSAWVDAFDLVVEVNTVQSLLPHDHLAGMRAIAGTVSDGGSLFLRCTGRLEEEPVSHRPYPLSRRELQAFLDEGLVETSFTEGRSPMGSRQFVATYGRPPVAEKDTPVRTGV